MDRRSFLSRSAIGSGAIALGVPALATEGCAGTVVRPGLSALDTEELLTRLERGLSTVRDVPLGEMASAMPWQVRPQLSENVLRLTLEGLIIADVARSVPEGTPMPRALAERLEPLMPVLAHAAQTHHALLSRMPPAVRRNIDRRVRTRPEIATDVAGWIDGHASELGVATESRLRLRAAASNVFTRIRRQSANAVIDDCLAKVDRAVVRRGGSPAPAPDTARMVDAMWQQVDGSSELMAPVPAAPPSATTYATDPSIGPPPLTVPGGFGAVQEMENPTEPVQWSEDWARPGDAEIQIGAIMMPFGLISCGLMLIIGLIVLIAGEVQNGEWDGRPREAQ